MAFGASYRYYGIYYARTIVYKPQISRKLYLHFTSILLYRRYIQIARRQNLRAICRMSKIRGIA